MAETIRLETDRVDGMCSIHDCERTSKHLWRVVEIQTDGESAVVNTVLAEYCHDHSQSHAEVRENLHYIGKFERVIGGDE